MKKMVGIMICAVLATAMITGCGDSSSTRTESQKATQTQAVSSTAPSEKAVKDADVFAGIDKNGGEKWFGLTREQVSQKSNGTFDKANAKESDENHDCYYLGEQSVILGGKADIGAKMPVYLWIYYKDGKTSKFVYSIDPEGTVSDADEKPVLAALEKYLTQNVPDGYSKKDGTPATGKGSFYFFNGDRNSYIFEVTVSSGVGSTNFPVRLTAQTYADKYGQ